MKITKKFIVSLFALALMSVPALAFEAKVPDYDVYCDFYKLEKETFYPPLVYKDITYFPMTYDYVRMLGLTSSWVDGVFYLSDSPAMARVPETVEQAPAVESLEAQIAQYPIYINGRLLDNSKEEYPLINARDITYFPMTNRFVREEFGLDINWDGSGLTVAAGIHYVNPGPLGGISGAGDGKIWLRRDGFEAIFGGTGNVSYHSGTYGQRLLIFDSAAGTFTETEDQDGFNDGLPPKSAEYEYLNEEKGFRVEEDGSLMFGDLYLEDMSAFMAESPNLNKDVHGCLYDLGGGLRFLSVYARHVPPVPVVHDDYRRSNYILTADGKAVPFDGENMEYFSGRYAGGVSWLCMEETEDSHLMRTVYRLYKVNADGTAVPYEDPDHGSIKLIGGDGGRLTVLATWLGERDGVSAVNDGYFYIEPDGSMTKIYPYVYADDMTVMDGHLYLLFWRNNTLVDACCGKEYSF